MEPATPRPSKGVLLRLPTPEEYEADRQRAIDAVARMDYLRERRILLAAFPPASKADRKRLRT